MKKLKVYKHTLETLSQALIDKGLRHLSIATVNPPIVTVKDNYYGDYQVDVKAFCESAAFPLHKARQHQLKMQRARDKVVGKSIKGRLVKDLFYGPDRGYKNRSFYAVIDATCGHETVHSIPALKKHMPFDSECSDCSKRATKHGERGKKDGVRPKRTSTYNHWQRIRETLPAEIREYEDFRRIVGEKPYARAELIITSTGAPKWSPLILVEDKETNLIATAIRQAFRYSSLYKDALEKVKVETVDGTRYRCANCNDLFKRSHVQVDHINPVAPVDSLFVDRDTLIDKIWTDKIQVLDRKCHSEKSTKENKLRRDFKKGIKNG